MSNNKRFNPYVSVDAEEEIVISGIAGQFPNSDNIKEFQNNLLNKMDLGSDDHQRFTNCNDIFSQIFFLYLGKTVYTKIYKITLEIYRSMFLFSSKFFSISIYKISISMTI